jgi:hypothetical protein
MEKIVITGNKKGIGKSTLAFNLAYGLAIEGRRVGIIEIYKENSYMSEIMKESIEKYKNPQIMQGIIKLMIVSEDEADSKEEMFLEKEWGEIEYLIVDCAIKDKKIIKNIENFKAIIVTETEEDSNESFKLFKENNIEIIGVVENKVKIYKREVGLNSNIISRIPFEEGIRVENYDGIPYIYKNYNTNGIIELKEIVDRIIDFEYGEEESAVKKITVGLLIDENGKPVDENSANKIVEIKIDGMFYKILNIKDKSEKNNLEILINPILSEEIENRSIEKILNGYIEELNKKKRHSCH